MAKAVRHVIPLTITLVLVLLGSSSRVGDSAASALPGERASASTDILISRAPGEQGVPWLFAPGVFALHDGAHGAYILWEDSYNKGIYAQHLDANGGALWQAGGIAVTPPRAGPPWRATPRGAPDGQGGVIVGWCETGDPWTPTGIHGQRLTAAGEKLWPTDGVTVTVGSLCTVGYGGMNMTADGAGGAIFALGNDTKDLQVQRIDGSGRLLWGGLGSGLPPSPEDTYGPTLLVADGTGGAIVAWETYGGGMPPAGIPSKVWVQRLDAGGQARWNGGSAMALGEDVFRYAAMVPDGAGGAIVAWGKYLGDPNLSVEGLAQRVDSQGHVMWQAGGVRLALARGSRLNPAMVPDGAGGAIVAWMDEREEGYGSCDRLWNCDIYAQRVTASGQVVWQANGIPIAKKPSWQGFPVMAGDGKGGALIAWQDCRAYSDSGTCFPNPASGFTGQGVDLYWQHVTAGGRTAGPADGFVLSDAPGMQGVLSGSTYRSTLTIGGNGAGAAFVAWPDGRHDVCALTIFQTECNVYARRIGMPNRLYLPIVNQP